MSPYSAPGITTPEEIDNLFEPIFVDYNDPHQVVHYLMGKVMAANGITEIEKKTRKTDHKEARQWYMFFARTILRYSLSRAGVLYDKDHATVLHSLKTIRNLVEGDKPFQDKYCDVIRETREYNKRIF
jgi:hypothetical protein